MSTSLLLNYFTRQFIKGLYFSFEILFIWSEFQQASMPCNVTAVSHNAQRANTNLTAPSRHPAHPVTTNSWGIQGSGSVGSVSAELKSYSCHPACLWSQSTEIWNALIYRKLSENFTYSTSECSFMWIQRTLAAGNRTVSNYMSVSSLPVVGDTSDILYITVIGMNHHD